jgi:hypothetical protein
MITCSQTGSLCPKSFPDDTFFYSRKYLSPAFTITISLYEPKKFQAIIYEELRDSMDQEYVAYLSFLWSLALLDLKWIIHFLLINIVVLSFIS